MTYSYDFNERLRMSCGVSAGESVAEILKKNIPGALDVHPAHGNNDRNGTDWWIEHCSGKHLSVDCKVREKDFLIAYGQDDLALESWSKIEQKKVGWTRNEEKRTDYILWWWQDSGRWCLLPFPMLCKVFQDRWRDWIKKYKTATQSTPTRDGAEYHSECVYVPRREVWAEIYRTYSGNALPSTPQVSAGESG